MQARTELTRASTRFRQRSPEWSFVEQQEGHRSRLLVPARPGGPWTRREGPRQQWIGTGRSLSATRPVCPGPGRASSSPRRPWLMPYLGLLAWIRLYHARLPMYLRLAGGSSLGVCLGRRADEIGLESAMFSRRGWRRGRPSMLIGDGGAQSEAPREEGKQEVVPVSFASGLQLFKRQHSIPSGDARGRGPGRWWACGLVTFQRALAAARQDKNGEPTKTAVSRAPEPADSSNQARQGPENWRRLPTGPSRVDPHPQPPPPPSCAGREPGF